MNDFRFHPNKTFVIAEIGINHNGSVDMAKQLIDAAVDAGCDAVKFQKRTPRMSLPPHLWDVVRDTPWGRRMTYLEYRERIELSGQDYRDLRAYCDQKDIWMSASPWDTNAANTVCEVGVPFIKIASASVTDLKLVEHIANFHLPVVMSTGMCDLTAISNAVEVLYSSVPQLGLLVCTSAYPAKSEDLNLNRIRNLQREFPDCVVGYSGHEAGLWTTLCAVAMGARIIERHITLDRTMPGTDQAASIEPHGFKLLVREIRNLELARGSGELRVLDCDKPAIARLRG